MPFMKRTIILLLIFWPLWACTEPVADTCEVQLTPAPAWGIYEAVFRVSEPVQWYSIESADVEALIALVDISPDGSAEHNPGVGRIEPSTTAVLDPTHLYRVQSSTADALTLTIAEECSGTVFNGTASARRTIPFGMTETGGVVLSTGALQYLSVPTIDAQPVAVEIFGQRISGTGSLEYRVYDYSPHGSEVLADGIALVDEGWHATIIGPVVPSGEGYLYVEFTPVEWVGVIVGAAVVSGPCCAS